MEDALGLEDFRPWLSPRARRTVDVPVVATRPPSSNSEEVEEAPLRRLLRECCTAMGSLAYGILPYSSKYLLRRCFRYVFGVQIPPRKVFGSLGLYLAVPVRKLGFMVSKLVISPTYKWGILMYIGVITH